MESRPTLHARPETTSRSPALTANGGGLLYPQQNRFRNLFDLSGLWEFQLDPKEEGEAAG